MARGYVAIEMSFDSRTDKVEMTARQDMTIEGTNGASISLKKGEKFTCVRAGSLGENMWYIVRKVFGEKKCSCVSYKPCVHEIHIATGRPLAELRAEVKARTKTHKPYVMNEAVHAKLTGLQKPPCKGTDISQKGNLNTSRAFSMWR